MKKALSFTDQPNFQSLVRHLLEANEVGEEVSIIGGAGVSVDAGFPGWSELVNRMCDGIEGGEFADLVRKDPIDDRRKVDYIVRMLDPKHGLADVVQEALYRDFQATTTGNLADAIARLSWSLGRVRLMTTNFEDQIEVALRSGYEIDSRSYSLIGEEQDGDSSSPLGLDAYNEAIDQGDTPVLHLHGMVVPNRRLFPLVLSESFFLRYGDIVKRTIEAAVNGGVLLFVGVSLADPNLAGPLNSCSDDGEQPLERTYVLVAPDPIAGEPHEKLIRYAHRRADYLEQEFRVKPIVLKSYAQVAQLVYELSVALADPSRYLSDDPSESLRYGHRLRRRLDEAYRLVGVEPDSAFEPSLQDSVSTCMQLARALAVEAPDGSELPGLLGSGVEDIPLSRLSALGLSRDMLRREDFGIFLWLRLRDIDKSDDSSTFALRLVGSSSYAHRTAWTLGPPIDVGPRDDFPSAKSAYFGTVLAENLDDERLSPKWRSILATPITASDEGEKSGPVHIGAATLNSTHRIYATDELQAGRAWVEDPLPSVISFLDRTAREAIAAALERSVLEAIKLAQASAQ